MTLTWFEKMPNTDAYRVNGHFAPYAVLARPVRFSDAELAAEYWAAALDADLMAPSHLVAITATVGRFATHPHFDETKRI